MGKHCASTGVLKGPWDQVFAAFWQRYPNPYRCGRAGAGAGAPLLGALGWAGSGRAPLPDAPPCPRSKHVLTEDIVHREVTPDQKLLSRRLLTKTNRMPRWAERFFPANVAHSVYILEDSIVDPQNQTMTTFTRNINHARLMVGGRAGPGVSAWARKGSRDAAGAAGRAHVTPSSPWQVVEERCVYRVNPENSGWTEVQREAWISSSLFGISRAVQVSVRSQGPHARQGRGPPGARRAAQTALVGRGQQALGS